jgi:hypothetical protein
MLLFQSEVRHAMAVSSHWDEVAPKARASGHCEDLMPKAHITRHRSSVDPGLHMAASNAQAIGTQASDMHATDLP